MLQIGDLKNLERKAFRATYQDGLLDINISGVVMSMAVMAFAFDSEAFPLLHFAILLGGLLVSSLIFWAGKKYITLPRLGQVKFGPQRRRRGRSLALVLAGIVAVQALIVAVTAGLGQNPEWAAALGLAQVRPDLERLAVAFIGAMFVAPGMALIAYFRDFSRGYYIAFILSLGVFAMIWLDQPLYMIAAGLLVLIPGVILFIRFLRDYPLPPVEVVNG